MASNADFEAFSLQNAQEGEKTEMKQMGLQQEGKVEAAEHEEDRRVDDQQGTGALVERCGADARVVLCHNLARKDFSCERPSCASGPPCHGSGIPTW